MTSMNSSQITTLDPYGTLGISHDASESEIRRAYRTLALRYHPDRNVEDKTENEKKMTDINGAYGILKDEEQKRRYDHLYRYGGIDNSSRNFNHVTHRNGSSRRRNNDVNHFSDPSDRDPFFHPPKSRQSSSQKAVYQSSNRTGKGGIVFSCTSSSSHFDASNGKRRHVKKTTMVRNGRRQTYVETTTTYPDGRVERDITENVEEDSGIFGFGFLLRFLGVSKQNQSATGKQSMGSTATNISNNGTTRCNERNINGGTKTSYHGTSWFNMSNISAQVNKCVGGCSG